VSDMKFY